MQAVIEPVNRQALKAELNADRFVRATNNGSNEIYVITHHNSPQVMREIGRLREVTFRAAGGGTGLDCDIDHYDTIEKCYSQLIVWNPKDEEIVGGYRFIKCKDAGKSSDGEYELATAKLFNFSDRFIQKYFDYTIELGRSFVQPKYQPSNENRKGLFSLDNLWDGLGAILVDNPDAKYYFGKITMYLRFNRMARDLILTFMNYYFPDNENLVTPITPLNITHNVEDFKKEIEGQPYKEGHRILNHHVRALGENIPPLFNSYMNISPTMKTFGTALNHGFGDVEETGILVTFADIYDTKKDRHVKSYHPQ